MSEAERTLPKLTGEEIEAGCAALDQFFSSDEDETIVKSVFNAVMIKVLSRSDSEPSLTTLGDVFSLEAENVRIATNFTVFNVAASSDAEGYFGLAGTVYSDDIEFSNDELFEMRNVRDRLLCLALEVF